LEAPPVVSTAEPNEISPEAIMKIIVDYDLCEANARCMQVCPEIFEVDDEDNLILHQETFDEKLRAKVEEAVRVCPRQAISIAKE
jgi:ferredoxin